MQEQLAIMDERLKLRKRRLEEATQIEALDTKTQLKFCQKIEKPPQRPPTPIIDAMYVYQVESC